MHVVHGVKRSIFWVSQCHFRFDLFLVSLSISKYCFCFRFFCLKFRFILCSFSVTIRTRIWYWMYFFCFLFSPSFMLYLGYLSILCCLLHFVEYKCIYIYIYSIYVYIYIYIQGADWRSVLQCRFVVECTYRVDRAVLFNMSTLARYNRVIAFYDHSFTSPS